MGIRFFVQKKVNNKLRTVESSGSFTSSYDKAKNDPVKNSEIYLIPYPRFAEPVVKQVQTLEEALSQIRKERPDVFTQEFDDNLMKDIKKPLDSLVRVEKKVSFFKKILQIFIKIVFWRL